MKFWKVSLGKLCVFMKRIKIFKGGSQEEVAKSLITVWILNLNSLIVQIIKIDFDVSWVQCNKWKFQGKEMVTSNPGLILNSGSKGAVFKLGHLCSFFEHSVLIATLNQRIRSK